MLLKNKCIIFPLLASMSLLLMPTSGFGSDEYDEWKKNYIDEFDSYRDEVDKGFSEFLKLEWKGFETQDGVKRDSIPKPTKLPSLKPKPSKALLPVSPIILPDKTVIEKPSVLPATIMSEGDEIEIVFLGHKISFFVKVNRNFTLSEPVSQDSLQKGFDILAQSDYENLIADLSQIKSSLYLNDWAYLQLVRQVSQSIYPNSVNSARLVSWFLLLKADIKSRIAFANNEIYLLMASKQALFDATFFRFNSEKFYVVSYHKEISRDLYTYNGQYPKKLAKADFSGINKIIMSSDVDYRTIKFSYGASAHEIKVPFNKHAIEFFASYPQMDIGQYFNVVISPNTKQSLLTQLEPLVEQLSPEESVNLLLRLVQTGFDYKTDQIQFGKENYLFLEETIYYPSSDCEDRSVIFAWLVENLLDLPVVGLSFPGHVATAVQLKNPSGQTIEYEGKIYTIADPTYINASVGRKMPQFDNVTPTVISHF